MPSNLDRQNPFPDNVPPPPDITLSSAPMVVNHQASMSGVWRSVWLDIVRRMFLLLRTLLYHECGLLRKYSPRCLEPDFTWPHCVLNTAQCPTRLTDLPTLAAKLLASWHWHIPLPATLFLGVLLHLVRIRVFFFHCALAVRPDPEMGRWDDPRRSSSYDGRTRSRISLSKGDQCRST